MGQTISFPHLQLPSRKTERLLRLYNRETTTSHNNNNSNNATFVRRSSMGGRLRSYGVILYQPPTPTTSTEAHGPTSEEDATAVSTPSPVVNDMISVGKRQWSVASSKASSSSVMTLTTHERSVASMTPSVSSSSATVTATPRRQIGLAATSSSVSAHASSSSGFSDAIVPVPPKSRLTHDRIMLGSSAASSTTSSANAMVVRSRSNGSKNAMAQPQHARLPKLRLGELEQIFAAIVTGDDSSTRAKIALSS